jgi:hypothetical protein
MEKLKTLKDLQDVTNPCMKCGSIQCAICYDDLKLEAIRWLKADKSNFYSREGMDETKLWIKEFFNITEGMLK